ncbi:hypothetical protein [Chelativorans intermedius]|uniref:Lipoprotein n=1 Tax=Chelativorans intermedius TaxID=515947 RepID=A0ABV6D6Z3_9HYPH|nr:hypothetical protein [Chelativorans intermedius]MCT8999545.1 hypothetical protein [Chelativorans intermedius]
MIWRSFIFLGALALISGCTTMTPEEQRAADEAECRNYGFRPGTDAFAECLQRVELDRRAEWRARRLEMERWNTPTVIYQPVVVEKRD